MKTKVSVNYKQQLKRCKKKLRSTAVGGTPDRYKTTRRKATAEELPDRYEGKGTEMAESGRHNNRGWLAAQRFTDEKRPTIGGQMVQTKEDPDRPLGLCDANHKNKGKPDTIFRNDKL